MRPRDLLGVHSSTLPDEQIWCALVAAVIGREYGFAKYMMEQLRAVPMNTAICCIGLRALAAITLVGAAVIAGRAHLLARTLWVTLRSFGQPKEWFSAASGAQGLSACDQR
jgi:hypothetical protein